MRTICLFFCFCSVRFCCSFFPIRVCLLSEMVLSSECTLYIIQIEPRCKQCLLSIRKDVSQMAMGCFKKKKKSYCYYSEKSITYFSFKWFLHSVLGALIFLFSNFLFFAMPCQPLITQTPNNETF